jgi:hypothetical protein
VHVVCHERVLTLMASPSCWHTGPVGVSARRGDSPPSTFRFKDEDASGVYAVSRSFVWTVPGSVPFSRSWVRRGPSLSLGEAGMGVWGKIWNRAVILRDRGFRVFPVHFRIGLPSRLFTRVVEP